ncbi:flagellin N-terminal helical domain-containing protein [Paucidesulfovibrio longus]|uniref:flagellin N-terminal helical domain-containing protein n=1 Tax=Paucidesulfovibrio longus TaxID=889 RepID=UPI0003B68138|nr:flagellar hook protein [Paucidesulfovibrio longus]
MRISTSQIYDMSIRNLTTTLSDYVAMNEKNSSLLEVAKASDDPSAMGDILGLRGEASAIQGWIDNCGAASDLLSLADESLQSASEAITSCLELAEQGSTGTYSADQLAMLAIEAREALQNLLEVANAKLGSQAAFAGNDITSDAYELGLGLTMVDGAVTASNAAVITGGTDETIWVQFDESGEIGTDELDYRYSTDGGETWTSATLAAGDTALDLGGATVSFDPGSQATAADGEGEGAGFMVRPAMTYVGAGRNTELNISEGTDVAITTVGSDIFGGLDSSGEAYEEPNLFETLGDLVAYLETGNHDGVAECLASLKDCQVNLEDGLAGVGARETRVNYTEESMTILSELVTETKSGKEDADETTLLVELSQAQYVYKSVLSTTSDLIGLSLLDYI